MSVQILIKDAAKERLILETLKAYEQLYPRRYKFCLHHLRKLREVTVAKATDLRGRDIRTTLRVPTEPFTFLQTQIPGFGDDSKDIDLLLRLWEDMARASNKDHRQRTRIW